MRSGVSPPTPQKGPSLKDRRSGLLLHISSLPGPYHCGDLGQAAFRFADFLAAGGQSWWQMLPVNPIGLGNSPYATACSFAGEPLYIDLEGLVADGLLKKKEIAPPRVPSASRADYAKARRYRDVRLKKAYQRFAAGGGKRVSDAYARFLERHRYWIEDFALFRVLAGKFKTADWRKWPPALRRRRPSALAEIQAACKSELDFIKFGQFAFFTQWSRLKAYLHSQGIGLIGDLPLFVGYHSSDVWAWQKFFRLKRDGSPRYVAGVPPDYYCPEGQLWGNPLYDWRALENDGFRWWQERAKHLAGLFDVVRLDHFIGFYRYWEIKADADSAKQGRFRKTPGRALFRAIEHAVGDLPFIAEDLGTVVPGVEALRDELGLPGMRVLQFGFGNDPSAAYHLPFSYVPNAVVYTGTHDNNTVLGWYADGLKRTHPPMVNLKLCRDFLGVTPRNLHWGMIREAMKSVANLTIFPVQDLQGLDSRARMNIPGKATGNWQWRMADNTLTGRLAAKLGHMTKTFNRLP